jgi:hypothetical protein
MEQIEGHRDTAPGCVLAGGEKYTIFIENEYSRERDGAGSTATSFFVYFLEKGVAFLSSLAYNEGYSIAALPQNKK